MDSDVWQIVRPYLTGSLLFVVYLVGIILALARWRRHPKVSLMALLGLGGLLLLRLVMPFVYLLAFRYLLRDMGAADRRQFDVLLAGMNLFEILLVAGAWVFILIAIFGGRTGTGARFPPVDVRRGDDRAEQQSAEADYRFRRTE